MDRVTFLKCQTWLKPLAASSKWPPELNPQSEDVKIRTQLILTSAGIKPDAKSNPTQELQENSLDALCCFHVGSQFCAFAASEQDLDQTQYSFELAVSTVSGESSYLFARFDKQHIFFIFPGAIRQLRRPNTNRSKRRKLQQSSNEPPLNQQPAFACFDFANVSLRFWLTNNDMSFDAESTVLSDAIDCIEQTIKDSASVSFDYKAVTSLFIRENDLQREVGSGTQSTSLLSIVEEVLTEQKLQQFVKICSAHQVSENDSREEMESQLASQSMLVNFVCDLFCHFPTELSTWFDLCYPGNFVICKYHGDCFVIDKGSDHTPIRCLTSIWKSWEEFLFYSKHESTSPTFIVPRQAGTNLLQGAASCFCYSIVTKNIVEDAQKTLKQRRNLYNALENIIMEQAFPTIIKKLTEDDESKTEVLLTCLRRERKNLFRQEIYPFLLPNKPI